MMIDLTSFSLEKIKQNRVPILDFNSDFIFPFYQGYSIANLPASIFHWLGAELDDSVPLNESIQRSLPASFDHVIFLVIDSLGHYLIDRFLSLILSKHQHSQWVPLLDNTTLTWLTSVCPSTTSTALTTLWTGKLPVEHGVIGYELWLKEFGALANMITHSFATAPEKSGSLSQAGFKVGDFLPVTTLGSLLKQKGIEVFCYQHESISGSGLSSMLMPDTVNISFRTFEELWLSVERKIRTSKSKTYSYVYWGDLDTLSHHYGPRDERVFQEWAAFSNRLGQFLNKIRTQPIDKTLFLLTADHGQISTPINDGYDLNWHPNLLDDLIMQPSGEGRIPYLFIHPEKIEALSQYCRKTWPGEFQLISKNDFLISTVLGDATPTPAVLNRLGDWVVLPVNRAYWWWAHKDNHLLGRHGGFLKDEMLVPLWAIQLH